MAITISGENNNDKILASDGVIDQISGFNIVGLLTASHINVGSNIQLGNAGIITATTFNGNVTGNINNSTLLLQTGGSERFRITGNNELGIAGANYGNAGQVLTSGGSGSAVSWTTITGTTINSNADNRLITATGTANTLQGETNLTFDGGTLALTGGSQNSRLSANILWFDRAGYSYIDQVNDSGSLVFRVTSGYTNALRLDSSAQAHFGADLYIPNSITHVGDTDTKMRFSGNNTIQFETGGNTAIKCVASGGIELYYDGDNVFQTSTNQVQVRRRIQIYADGVTSGHAMSIGQWDGNNHRIEGDANRPVLITSYNSGGVQMGVSGTEKVRVNSDGIIIKSSSSSNGLFVNHSNGNEVARLAHNGSGDEGILVLKDSGSNTIILNGENGQNCFIAGPNALHFGNTTGAGTGTRGVSISAVTSGNPVFIQTSSRHYTSGSYSHWYIYDDHGMVGRVTANGDGTTSYVSSSDYRLKENVVPITDGITKLKTLKPYRFNFKTTDASKVVQGFFAHEVSEACPNAVDGNKDEMKSLYYDEEDDIPSGKAVGDFKEFSTTEINPQGLDVAKLVPLLTAALQEAITKIETLETKVATLEGS